MSRRLQVLIVDDERNVRDAHSALIDALGHAPVAAVNGYEALDLVGRRGIDVIITDLCMPVMDGLDLVVSVRRMKGLRQPYIVMVTSTPDAVSEDEIEELSIRAVLGKPASRIRIEEHIAEALMELGIDE